MANDEKKNWLEGVQESGRSLFDRVLKAGEGTLSKETFSSVLHFPSSLGGPIPPFSLTKPRFDQNTLFGRILYRYQQCDPSTLLVTNSQLICAKKRLKLFAEGKRGALTDSMLWEARRIKEAVTHPDTGETIFPLFRFSAYAPMNIFIVSIMLAPSTIRSPLRTFGIHWFNQSYNVTVNYSNRNASNPIPTARLAQGYFAAVGSSVGIALGATYLLNKIKGSGGIAATTVRAVLPFLAIITAGCANVSLVRRNELVDGVELFDGDGHEVGRSVKAGYRGIGECCVSRVLWNIPIMLIPPYVMLYLNKTRLLTRMPRLRLPTEVGVIVLCLFAGVPLALAAFPEYEKISSSDVEEKYQHLKDSKGEPAASNTTWSSGGIPVPCSDEVMVPVKVYYESLCDACQHMVGTVVKGVFDQDPSIVDVAHMQLAPFGHAQSTGNGQFSCQHGVKECDGNVVELCAMGLSQWNFSSYFPFIGCLEKTLGQQIPDEDHVDPNANLMSIASTCIDASTPFTQGDLQNCYDNKYSSMLEWASTFTQAQESVTPWEFIPVIAIGDFNACGKEDDAGTYTLIPHANMPTLSSEQLKNVICEKYAKLGGNTSAVCAAATPSGIQL